MTLNEYFAAGNHLLTQQMIEDNNLSEIFNEDYTGGLPALEHAARLKYGYSTLLPQTPADVQRAALGVILINRPKYDQWAAAIINAVEYDPFVDFKITESGNDTLTKTGTVTDEKSKTNTGNDTLTKTGTVTDEKSKTNTGTQSQQNGGSVQRTDALTETTQHGATNTHAKNSYNNGTLRDETRDTMGGSDTVNNTGTQTTTDTTTSTRTDNLTEQNNTTKTNDLTDTRTISKTEQNNATKTNNLTDTHNISKTKQGFTKSPAETYAKNLSFFRRSMIMDMCDDICGYITLFDFTGVI